MAHEVHNTLILIPADCQFSFSGLQKASEVQWTLVDTISLNMFFDIILFFLIPGRPPAKVMSFDADNTIVLLLGIG